MKTVDGVRLLRAAVQKAGGVTLFAASLEIPPAFIYQILRTGVIPPNLCKFLGIKAITVYVIDKG